MSDFDYRCLDCKHEWDEEDGATWPARCPSCGSGSIEDPDDEGPPEIAADTTSSNPWDGVERRAKFHDLPGSPFAFRRFETHPPLVEGAAYGTSMVERRTVKDRRRDMALLPIRRRNPVDYAAREAAGLTQTQSAALVYATLRNWQQWEQETGTNVRRMHPGLWELFLLKTKTAIDS
jgi:hypothetical protein